MAERTAEDWGRVAVSLPGWQPPNGAIGWDSRGVHAQIDPFGALMQMTPTGSCYGDLRGFVPDPDDPATAGCLLALLGGRRTVRILPRVGRTLCEIVIPKSMTPDGRPHRITGHDLGRACIAAAEAIGRWPGGAA